MKFVLSLLAGASFFVARADAQDMLNNDAFVVRVGSNSGTMVERMRIDQDGLLAVGTTGVLPDSIAGAIITNTVYIAAADATTEGGELRLAYPSSIVAPGRAINSWIMDAYTGPSNSNDLRFFRNTGGTVSHTLTLKENGSIELPGLQLAAGTHGLCYSNSTKRVTFCNAMSDRRLKDDIKTLPHSLESLSKIRGVSYRWRDAETYGGGFEKDIGLIAQDVEKVFPDLVRTEPNGFKSVRYDKLVAPLIEAVKELKDETRRLDQELSALKLQMRENASRAPEACANKR